jgi:hypothetical protein
MDSRTRAVQQCRRFRVKSPLMELLADASVQFPPTGDTLRLGLLGPSQWVDCARQDRLFDVPEARMSSVDPANADAANAPADPPLPCPKCQQQTDSLKQYSVPTVLFIVIAWAVRKSTEVACPSCMRKTVLRQTLINVPTANILWPLVIVPYAGIEFYLASRKGHSTEIRKRLWPEQYPAAAATPVAMGPGARRFLGFLKIVAGMAAIAAMGYFLFRYWYDWGTTIWAFAALAAAGVGVAFAMVMSGVGAFRTESFAPSALVRMGVAGAAVFLAISPFAARAYWKSQEVDLAARDAFAYLHRLPAQFWTPGGVTELIDWKANVLSSSGRDESSRYTAQGAYDDLRYILADVKTHHGGDEAFQAIVARIEGLLVEYKRFDQFAAPDDAPMGPFDDTPAK